MSHTWTAVLSTLAVLGGIVLVVVIVTWAFGLGRWHR